MAHFDRLLEWLYGRLADLLIVGMLLLLAAAPVALAVWIWLQMPLAWPLWLSVLAPVALVALPLGLLSLRPVSFLAIFAAKASRLGR